MHDATPAQITATLAAWTSRPHRVWPSPERAAALVGEPRAVLLELVEDSAAATGVR